MSEKSVFPLKFEVGDSVEESYQVVLDKITEDLYSDGTNFFTMSETMLYVLEADKKGKEKKRRVAKRKGNDLVLTDKKDKLVFSPEVIVYNNSSHF